MYMQAVLFLLAGYETTAATLMFAVYLLALHPEAQSRLHQELDQGREVLRRRVVHAGSGAPVSKAGGGGAVAAAPAGPMDMNGSHPATAAARGDDQKSSSVAAEGSNEAGLNNEEIAKHFPYACGVIEEALRLYPPAAGTSRETPEDMEILGYRWVGGQCLRGAGAAAAPGVLPANFAQTCAATHHYALREWLLCAPTQVAIRSE
jgi:cytochrome P450